MHARGRFLSHALYRGETGRIPPGILGKFRLDRREQAFLFLAAGFCYHREVALGLGTQVQEQRRIAAIVQDHVRQRARGPFEDAMRVVPIFGERFALDRKHRRAAHGDCGRCVILCRVDVARSPAHIGTERFERLDQHRGLDGHVERPGNTGAAQRLDGRIFLADRHEAGHFGLGNGDFLAAPVGEGKVGYFEIGESRRRLAGGF